MAELRIRKDRHGKPAWYVLDFSDETGRHQITLGRIGILPERDARNILKAKQLELSTGGKLLQLGRPRAPTFDAYCEHVYLPWHADAYPASHPRILQIITQYLSPRFGHVALDAIAVDQVEAMKRERRRSAKAHTVAKELRQLKAVLNHAVRHKHIAENPISLVQAPKILDAKPHLFYEPEQLRALYAACSAVIKGARPEPMHAAIWKLLANTGMRRGEALALRTKNIGREEIRIVSTGEERTKSGDWRTVPKTEGAAEAIDRLKHLQVPEGYLIPRIEPPSLSRAFVNDARRAGLDGSLHTLRHTYISLLVRDTQIPIRTVQLWAGHKKIETTEGYLYLRDRPGAPILAMNL